MENSVAIKRTKKIIAYIILFGVISFTIYLIRMPASTCSDKIKNQGEKGVDCGGPCTPCQEAIQAKDISVQEVSLARGGNNTYDVVAKISNPNDSVGAQIFKYAFTLKNAEGAVIATREGTSFVLPADTRYVAELGIATLNGLIPANASISISGAQWGKLANIGKPQIGVYSKNFEKIPSGGGDEASGIIRNESGFDLKTIDIVILLRDEKGHIIGINTTQKSSIRANEQQNFQVTWPYALGADVQKMEVDPQTNIFDPRNFYTVQ